MNSIPTYMLETTSSDRHLLPAPLQPGGQRTAAVGVLQGLYMHGDAGRRLSS